MYCLKLVQLVKDSSLPCVFGLHCNSFGSYLRVLIEMPENPFASTLMRRARSILTNIVHGFDGWFSLDSWLVGWLVGVSKQGRGQLSGNLLEAAREEAFRAQYAQLHNYNWRFQLLFVQNQLLEINCR